MSGPVQHLLERFLLAAFPVGCSVLLILIETLLALVFWLRARHGAYLQVC
jgi:hypothetical protein